MEGKPHIGTLVGMSRAGLRSCLLLPSCIKNSPSMYMLTILLPFHVVTVNFPRSFLVLASQVVLVVKNPPANPGESREEGSILDREDPLEEGTETHSSILAWRIP